MMFSPLPKGWRWTPQSFCQTAGSMAGSGCSLRQGGEAVAEAGAEDAAQRGLGHEEVGVLDGDDAAVGIDARAGHDAVEVGVEMQALVPGVEDHGEAAGFRAEPFGIGERVGQGGGGGGEEELIDLFCLRGEEQRTQFLGQGEGDHEVGRADAFAEFAFHPLGGGVLAALRTGAVVAAVEAELPCAARRRHGGARPFAGAAMGDGPGGAPLCLAHGVTVFTQMGGQEAAQRVDDGGGQLEAVADG